MIRRSLHTRFAPKLESTLPGAYRSWQAGQKGYKIPTTKSLSRPEHRGVFHERTTSIESVVGKKISVRKIYGKSSLLYEKPQRFTATKCQIKISHDKYMKMRKFQKSDKDSLITMHTVLFLIAGKLNFTEINPHAS